MSAPKNALSVAADVAQKVLAMRKKFSPLTYVYTAVRRTPVVPASTTTVTVKGFAAVPAPLTADIEISVHGVPWFPAEPQRCSSRLGEKYVPLMLPKIPASAGVVQLPG